MPKLSANLYRIDFKFYVGSVVWIVSYQQKSGLTLVHKAGPGFGHDELLYQDKIPCTDPKTAEIVLRSCLSVIDK